MATIELVNGEQLKAAQTAVAATDLVSCGLTQKFVLCKDDDNNTVGKILGKLKALQDSMLGYMGENNRLRIAELEAELVEVCQQGRIAEAELATANNGVLIARQTNAALENNYNLAQRDLQIAKDAKLPRFYNKHDEDAKARKVAIAEVALNKALDDMAQNPLGVPTAMQRKQEAERKVMALAAREAGYRRELATLTGKAAQPTGNAQNATGLAG